MRTLVWAAAGVAAFSAAAFAQGGGVSFSLDPEGPWAVYWAAPVTGTPGVNAGATAPPAVYAAPDDNLDALYAGHSSAPTVVLFSLDEQFSTISTTSDPGMELYRTFGNRSYLDTGVTELTLGLAAGSNVDGFDVGPAAQPDPPLAVDYSVDIPDSGGGPTPPGDVGDIYMPQYVLSADNVLNLGLAQGDNVDAYTLVDGHWHMYGDKLPLAETHWWPAGVLFSVEPGGPSGLDGGDIYWSNLGGHFPIVYLDDVNSLGIGEGHDIDALATLGAGPKPPWFDPVPEPCSAILILVGVGLVADRGRRR